MVRSGTQTVEPCWPLALLGELNLLAWKTASGRPYASQGPARLNGGVRTVAQADRDNDRPNAAMRRSFMGHREARPPPVLPRNIYTAALYPRFGP